MRCRPTAWARWQCESVGMGKKPGLPCWEILWQRHLHHRVLSAKRQVAPLRRHHEAVVQQVVGIRPDSITHGHSGHRRDLLSSLQHHCRGVVIVSDVRVGSQLLELGQIAVCEERHLWHREVVVNQVDEGHDCKLCAGSTFVVGFEVRQLHGLSARHHDHGPLLKLNNGHGLLDARDKVDQLVILGLYRRVHIQHVHVQQVCAIELVKALIIPKKGDVA
mmetsp:Transcript_45815/g.74464  ORF Transcript_45815/g.74464 Transcript_45815/m.74464 type:complete len:219 (-) Transcript_45815:862-1518(-)